MSYEVIITGIQPWDIEIGSNCKNIALEFSKTKRVLYVNPPLDRATRWRDSNNPKVIKRLEVIDQERSPFEYINHNLVVYTPNIMMESMNWLPHYFFRMINKFNSVKFAKSIKSAIDQLSFSNYILFTDSDMFRSKYVSKFIRPKVFLYYTRDNLMTVPYWSKHGEVMEPEIMKEATAVVANSTHLANIASSSNTNSFYVGQGCEVGEYLEADGIEAPIDLLKINRPIVGYTGLLTSRRLSIELIENVAKHLPHVSIVLIGPEEKCFLNSKLHEFKNVHFLGSKKPEELPSYVANFDVCVNPQAINELTKGNYPRKIDEYLAAGKPVVATYTPAMEVFSNHCYLAETSDEFISKITTALFENHSTKIDDRREFAKGHTWAASVDKIEQVILKFLTQLESNSYA